LKVPVAVQRAVTLGDIADRSPMLDVVCSKCDRRGRLGTAS
jgi:hypothetical protein